MDEHFFTNAESKLQVLKMEQITSELLEFRKFMSEIQGAKIKVYIYYTQAKFNIDQFR